MWVGCRLAHWGLVVRRIFYRVIQTAGVSSLVWPETNPQNLAMTSIEGGYSGGHFTIPAVTTIFTGGIAAEEDTATKSLFGTSTVLLPK